MSFVPERAAPFPEAKRSVASRPGAAMPTPRRARLLAAAVLAVAAVAGFVATDPALASDAVRRAGPELTRLLRAMALLKLSMVAAAAAGVFWRLGAAVGRVRLVAYLACLAAMAAGPGLIWDMRHVRLGALLLHGGLLATVLILWRDPGTTARLAGAIAARRARLALRR